MSIRSLYEPANSDSSENHQPIDVQIARILSDNASNSEDKNKEQCESACRGHGLGSI
ncbi:hypothetical protein [Neorhodopirellula lusitana]|uniref:hypothetical protein n=1 Tax=Neorhodopirellula lusitana TaxID=445327 RepID=UPI0024B7D8C7|nr:hypothetical protein [Neorhodopirellula lusitana]